LPLQIAAKIIAASKIARTSPISTAPAQTWSSQFCSGMVEIWRARRDSNSYPSDS
jgi:hypothetical protein